MHNTNAAAYLHVIDSKRRRARREWLLAILVASVFAAAVCTALLLRDLAR